MIFSNAFYWMKIIGFWFNFLWPLFLGVQSTVSHDWLRYWLGGKQELNHYQKHWWPRSMTLDHSGLIPSIHKTISRHYDDVIMTMLASQITSLTAVYSIVYSDVNQRKHQSSASLAFVREIHRGPVNFPHKWPVTWKMFPFDDVIMCKRQEISLNTEQ